MQKKETHSRFKTILKTEIIIGIYWKLFENNWKCESSMSEDYFLYATQRSNFDQTILHDFWSVWKGLMKPVLMKAGKNTRRGIC